MSCTSENQKQELKVPLARKFTNKSLEAKSSQRHPFLTSRAPMQTARIHKRLIPSRPKDELVKITWGRPVFVLFADNATRMCFPDGSWQLRSNYSQCKPLLDDDEVSGSFSWLDPRGWPHPTTPSFSWITQSAPTSWRCSLMVAIVLSLQLPRTCKITHQIIRFSASFSDLWKRDSDLEITVAC